MSTNRPSWSANWVCLDRKSTRLNSSHSQISYAVFCLKKKKIPHSLSLPPKSPQGLLSRCSQRPLHAHMPSPPPSSPPTTPPPLPPPPPRLPDHLPHRP